MQIDLNVKERTLLCRCLDTILNEAKWDYNKIADFSVVSINAQKLVFSSEKIKQLKKVFSKLEGEG